jgi:D-glycero-D-manno-heptose 1,7-bisphosphate phosphatase
MLYLAAQKHGIDLAQSYFLGDTLGDLCCALRAGCQPLLVLTGLGRETYARLSELPESIPYFERVADTVSIWGVKGIASRDLV